MVLHLILLISLFDLLTILGLEAVKYVAYQELTYFNKAKVSSDVRLYACQKMLNFYEDLIKDYDYRNMKLFPPLKYLISSYSKNKDLKGLKSLLDFVTKFPKLEILYCEKINNYIKKIQA